MDKKTLATALRGASEELKNYIFKSMSSRAVEMLKEDMEVLGPVNRGRSTRRNWRRWRWRASWRRRAS
jgi:flagellar motor switch protein FliG